ARCFLLISADPRGVRDAGGGIALEGAFLRVDRYQGEFRVFAGVVAAHDDTFVDHRCAQIPRAPADHVVAQAAPAAAVVRDGALDIADEFSRIRLLYVVVGQAALFAGGGIGQRDDGFQAAVGEIGMRMPKAERAPLWFTVIGPALRVGGDLGDVRPAELLI